MNNFETSSSSLSEDDMVIFRRPKIYCNRKNCFVVYDDQDFFEKFRLTKPTTVLELLNKIEHLLKLPSNRGSAITPIQQLLLTLRFYATGNMLISVADFIGVSKSSASYIVKRVSSAIALLSKDYIKMPETNAEMESVSAAFYKIASFPRTIGAIDCTLIKIESPGGPDAEMFRSRKDFFALNVQTVSDANLTIMNIVARWPVSVHDQTIFNNNFVKERFQNGVFNRYMLIGDSGYTLQPFLMTKLQTTHTRAENLYNESLLRTRNVVERQYGVWKRRFPVLKLGMTVHIEISMNIIIATAVLHNTALIKEAIPEEWLEQNVIEKEDFKPQHANNVRRYIRQLIINEHFANL